MLKDNSNRVEILNYPVENMNLLHYVAKIRDLYYINQYTTSKGSDQEHWSHSCLF